MCVCISKGKKTEKTPQNIYSQHGAWMETCIFFAPKYFILQLLFNIGVQKK